jgi:two-component system chemotaxis response regulator CheB
MAYDANRKIRVLVVDDSRVIRAIIADSIAGSPVMEVAGTAADGRQALEAAASLHPDVVTLDVQMPNMDGLATLDALVQRHAVPVVMVSSLTQRGAEATLDALERGAVDYVAKPDGTGGARQALGDELLRKIHNAAGADVQRLLRIRRERKLRLAVPPRDVPARVIPPAAMAQLSRACIAIGISTGGPPALTRLFSALRPPLPPIVVVQHMPPQFTKPLAWRLDSLSELSIQEAAGGEELRPNQVLIAPGGRHVEIRRHGAGAKATVNDGLPVSGHKPSVDVMMKSVAETFGPRTLGVIMTGMGHDGVDGCRAIRAAGGVVLGQDEATSEVYGMNKAAHLQGCVDLQFSLEKGAAAIAAHAQRLLAPADAAPPSARYAHTIDLDGFH